MRKWALAAVFLALGASPAGAGPLTWGQAIEALATHAGKVPGEVRLRSLVVQDIREAETQSHWPLSEMLATSLSEVLGTQRSGFKVLNAERSGTLGPGVDGVLTGTIARAPGGYRLSLQVQRLATRETLYVLPTVEVAEGTLPAGAVPKSGFGRLVVGLDVPEARVFVDGEPLGSGSRALPLALGAHLVTVAAEGYEVFEQSVQIRPEAPAFLEVRLKRKALSAKIESSEPGARVSIDGKPHGLTPLALADLAPGKHRLTVTKAGFRPYEADIDWQGKDQVIRVELALLPGSLVVSADVPEALVSLDGQPRGKAPLLLSDLGPGLHRLSAIAPGHAPFEQDVRVVSAETLNVRARLTPDVQGKEDEAAFTAVALLPRTTSKADLAFVRSVAHHLGHPGGPVTVPPDEALRTMERLMPEGWREDPAALKGLARALKARRLIVLGLEDYAPFTRDLGVWPQRPSLSASMATFRSSGYREGDPKRFHRTGGEPWGFGSAAPGHDELASDLALESARDLADAPGAIASFQGEELRHEGFVLAGTSRLDMGLGYAYRVWPSLDLGLGYRYFNAVGDDRTSGTRLSASGPGSDLVYGQGQAHLFRLEALYRFDGVLPRRGPAYEGPRWIPYLGAGYRVDLARYEVYGVGRAESEGAFWQPRQRAVAIAGLKLNLGGILYRAEGEVPVVYQVGDSNAVRWTLGAGWVF